MSSAPNFKRDLRPEYWKIAARDYAFAIWLQTYENQVMDAIGRVYDQQEYQRQVAKGEPHRERPALFNKEPSK